MFDSINIPRFPEKSNRNQKKNAFFPENNLCEQKSNGSKRIPAADGTKEQTGASRSGGVRYSLSGLPFDEMHPSCPSSLSAGPRQNREAVDPKSDGLRANPVGSLHTDGMEKRIVSPETLEGGKKYPMSPKGGGVHRFTFFVH